MAYVSLEAAKDHLYIAQDDASRDLEVERKLEHATGIIRDYLKGRADVPATIVSSSVASPTVIVTDGPHGFTSGDEAVLAGHSGSTPTINGTRIVTVIDEESFTVPVAVTVAGTGGTATVLWNDVTAPPQVQAATLKMLGHLYENRGDDMKADAEVWESIRRLLERSRDPAFA